MAEQGSKDILLQVPRHEFKPSLASFLIAVPAVKGYLSSQVSSHSGPEVKGIQT